MKMFYEKNPIITDYSVNVTFEELLAMNKEKFEQWVISTRKAVVTAWDTLGCPPRNSANEQEIIDEFNKLTDANVNSFTHDDELDLNNKGTVIYNTLHLGTQVDQWFSNMMKVPMNYSSNNTGYSVYDLFSKDEYLPSMIKRSHRHFHRDSFYHYSKCIKKNDVKSALIDVDSGNAWLDEFFENKKIFKNYDFWISENEQKEGPSTGYYQVQQSDFLHLTADDVKKWLSTDNLKYRHVSNIDINNLKPDCIYLIRLYEKNQRIFPKGFVAFRIGYISVPINFPPLTAKYLYQKYTKSNESFTIYDPSSGWGGRILGAMSVKDDRKIHYIGTDPNPDNHIDDKTSKYSDIADFFNNRTYRNGMFDNANTYDIYKEGSEEIHKHPRFKKYKGKIDLIFTSPPYFNREQYSTDPNQSCIKYGSSYESWRDGFLKPTLETCAKYLKPGGYLLWNIADVLTEKGYLPLEEDSRQTLLQLGMIEEPKLKMVLASMPGSQRLDENGVPKCKNFCKIKGTYHKYEPIYVFRKPL